MKKIKSLLTIFIAFTIFVSLLTSCASMFINGSTMVDAGYEPQEIFVKYDSDGTTPVGVEYWLVKDENGEGIFERSVDGSGVIFQIHWNDEDGDHYAGWVSRSHAWEYIIPTDRSENGKRYVYPAGYYGIKEVDGQERPVMAVSDIEPVATLIPRK